MPKSPVRPSRKIPVRRATQAVFERLEGRTMLSVSINPTTGATVITPGPGDRVIYCSSSTGNDKNNGLSPQSPVATFAAAEKLMRDHTGDELLLKTGDVWHSSFGYWGASGASAQDPMVIGSYGSGPRPLVLTGLSNAFMTGKLHSTEVDYIALMGISFIADGRDPNLTSTPASTKDPTGISICATSNDILIENCQVQYYSNDIVIEKSYGTLQNVSIRRNIVTNAYAVNVHAQGLYALGVTNLTLDGNLFDQNGYNAKVPGAVATWYNQDVYLNSTNTGVVITDNIFARAGGYGLQDRPGGIVKNNIFIDNPTGMSYGLVSGASSTAGGVSGSVTGNVFYSGANLGSMRGGQALVVGNLKASANVVIGNNIFADGIPDAQAALELGFGGGQPNSAQSVGINNLTLKANVFYNWTSAIDVGSSQSPGGAGLTAFNNVSFTGNEFDKLSGTPLYNHGVYTSQEHFSGNVYSSTGPFYYNGKASPVVGQVLSSPIPFVDPTRTVASYNGSGSDAAFLAAAAQQNETAWKPAVDASSVVAYFQNGFALKGSIPSSPVTPPVTPPATSAKSTVQALNYTAQSGGMKFDNFKGLGYIYGGDWAEYDNLDFGTGITNFTANLAAMTSSGQIQLRLDSVSGPVIGTLNVTATGAWNNYKAESTKVSGATGVHKLFLVFEGGAGVCNLESFTFA